MSTAIREVENRRAQKFRSLGEQARAVALAERDGFANRDSRLVEVRAATGMGESVGSDGGFAVQTEFAEQLLNRVVSTGELLSRTTRVPVGEGRNRLHLQTVSETSRADGSRWGGLQVYWLAEGSALTASAPELRRLNLPLLKAAGLVWATDELVEDVPALDATLTNGFTEELQFKIEDAIINGTGAGQLFGILNSDALVTVAAEGGQAANTIVWANVKQMWARCWGRSKRQSVWLVNDDVYPELLEMTIPVGTGGTVPAVTGGRLLGRPIVPCEHCPTLGTLGDIILADLSQFVIAEKPIGTAISLHARFTNDEVGFRAICRVNGQPLWAVPVTPKNGTDTQSPFVALATRS